LRADLLHLTDFQESAAKGKKSEGKYRRSTLATAARDESNPNNMPIGRKEWSCTATTSSLASSFQEEDAILLELPGVDIKAPWPASPLLDLVGLKTECGR